MSRLTKKNKVTIAVSVFAIAVLLFSIIMFGIWAGVEVYCEKMSYETLQKKFGEHFIVPSGLEDDVLEPCRVYFPKAEPDSNHRYGKYTNLTVKNKYATSYHIDLKGQGVTGYISANKDLLELSFLLAEEYEVICLDGIEVYYMHDIYENSSFKYYREVEINTNMAFVLDNVYYYISTRVSVEGDSVDGNFTDEDLEVKGSEKVNEYARYLFEKFFK